MNKADHTSVGEGRGKHEHIISSPSIGNSLQNRLCNVSLRALCSENVRTSYLCRFKELLHIRFELPLCSSQLFWSRGNLASRSDRGESYVATCNGIQVARDRDILLERIH